MTEAWNNVLAFTERYPYAEALGIVVVALLLALIADRVLSGTVSRIVARSETDFDDDLVRILHRPIFSTIALIGLTMAFYRLELEAGIESAAVTVVQTILVIVWVAFAVRFFRMVLSAMRTNPSRFEIVQQTTEPLLSNAMAVLAFVVGAYSILVIWDINITGLVASAGIVGLALGFAAQDTLSNLFAGVAILSDRPYQIGDFIILDTGERGQVTRIGLRSTSLLTRDDVEISIPNAIMGSTKIVNEAGGPPQQYRVRAAVGVAYGSDIDEVTEILVSIGANHPLILPHPVPQVRFLAFGDSSLDFELQCWIKQPVDRGVVLHELNSAIYHIFNERGVKIPFPQRDIHIKQAPPSSSTSD